MQKLLVIKAEMTLNEFLSDRNINWFIYLIPLDEFLSFHHAFRNLDWLQTYGFRA